MRILIIEDNEKLARYTKQMLEEEGYAVDTSNDGESGERISRSKNHDLIILDIMIPKKDGVSVCKSLRKDNINIPIIMITAKGELDDRILGLDSGADDYLIKPFEMEELLARVRALLRRPKEKIINQIKIKDIILNNNKHSVTQKGVPLLLTLKEYSILEHLMINADNVVTREELLEHCWDFAYSAFSNITDVYIKQLRKKLKDKNEKYIKTIRGVGYSFSSK